MGMCCFVLVSVVNQMCEVSSLWINHINNNSYEAKYKIKSLDYKPSVPPLSGGHCGPQNSCLVLPVLYSVGMPSCWPPYSPFIYSTMGVFISILVKTFCWWQDTQSFQIKEGTYHFWNRSCFMGWFIMDSLAKADGLFSAFVFSATNLTGCASGIHFIRTDK